MIDSYFTFGQDHTHRVNGFTYDCDVVVKITGDDPAITRQIMFEHFGSKWAFQYDGAPPDLQYFPRGIKELKDV